VRHQRVSPNNGLTEVEANFLQFSGRDFTFARRFILPLKSDRLELGAHGYERDCDEGFDGPDQPD
jgi:hypothetical protein